MLIVPIAGDRIKTQEDLPYKVLGFTNLKADGPAVSCESVAGGTLKDIQFSEISEINDRKVIYYAVCHSVNSQSGSIEDQIKFRCHSDCSLFSRSVQNTL
jgi:hypothetical protein